MRKFKSKPRAPAYVQEVYQRIETEMCTARNAVVALDLRDVETLPKVWEPLDDPQTPKSTIAARTKF